jgi:uncharacterized protein (DUF1778 family)
LRWRQEIASIGHQDSQRILAKLETGAIMNKTIKAAISHHEREVAELRADKELAVEYLKAAMESLDDPNDRSAGLLALHTVAEAYGELQSRQTSVANRCIAHFQPMATRH